jgi:hypothetical protein
MLSLDKFIITIAINNAFIVLKKLMTVERNVIRFSDGKDITMVTVSIHNVSSKYGMAKGLVFLPKKILFTPPFFLAKR